MCIKTKHSVVLVENVSFFCSVLFHLVENKCETLKKTPKKQWGSGRGADLDLETYPLHNKHSRYHPERMQTWLITSKAALYLRGAAKDVTATRLRPEHRGLHFLTVRVDTQEWDQGSQDRWPNIVYRVIITGWTASVSAGQLVSSQRIY